MAAVLRKRKDPPSSVGKEFIVSLDRSIRAQTEAQNRNTDKLVRSQQELTKALNAATREFKKTK